MLIALVSDVLGKLAQLAFAWGDGKSRRILLVTRLAGGWFASLHFRAERLRRRCLVAERRREHRLAPRRTS